MGLRSDLWHHTTSTWNLILSERRPQTLNRNCWCCYSSRLQLNYTPITELRVITLEGPSHDKSLVTVIFLQISMKPAVTLALSLLCPFFSAVSRDLIHFSYTMVNLSDPSNITRVLASHSQRHLVYSDTKNSQFTCNYVTFLAFLHKLGQEPYDEDGHKIQTHTEGSVLCAIQWDSISTNSKKGIAS